MTDYEVGEDKLRATTYDNAIKQIAIYSYKMKQLVSSVSSGSWKNYFSEKAQLSPKDKKEMLLRVFQEEQIFLTQY